MVIQPLLCNKLSPKFYNFKKRNTSYLVEYLNIRTHEQFIWTALLQGLLCEVAIKASPGTWSHLKLV